MKNQIKFSIIMPNYNKGQYIETAINSVLNQSYKNFELIVVDDGSTDNSLEVISRFDVKFVSSNRLMAGGARNKGLEIAVGDYILFLDSDDYFTDNTVLEKLTVLIDDEDLIFLNYTKDNFGEVSFVSEDKESIASKIENTKNLGCPTKCFKKDLIQDMSFPEKKRYEDINFVLEAICRAKSFSYFDGSFFTYRKVNASNTTSEVSMEAMVDILEELVGMYRLCVKYPEYKLNILNRIKNDKIDVRLDILNHLIEFNENKFSDFFS